MSEGGVEGVVKVGNKVGREVGGREGVEVSGDSEGSRLGKSEGLEVGHWEGSAVVTGVFEGVTSKTN